MTDTAPKLVNMPPTPLARLGQFEVRLARTDAERFAAYRLRYEVFHRERGVNAQWMDHVDHIEADAYDLSCDHIIVIDTCSNPLGQTPSIVGTYRVMASPAPSLGWYADTEFALGPLFARHPDQRFCEVGRSCVAPAYRSMRTIEALWCGLWAYACYNRIDAYFGAASFPGTEPHRHALALSHLYHAARATNDWHAVAHAQGAVSMNMLASEHCDRHAALRAMPPLVRGYLRVNAVFGSHAFVDEKFSTTDVFVLTRFAAAPAAYRRRVERVTGLRHPNL
ncbi:GNAT family N-acetyltransferase [Pelagibacterium sp.]|uniref:GNAT family N-acetyltransferase n=1 Tax=Pelagibacterium sp. TaxID=1967288 RepID=UPI003A9472F9